MNMLSRSATGLILRLRPLGESDLLVDLFSKEMGRITALAKGGKRSKQRFFGVLLAGHLLQLGLARFTAGGSAASNVRVMQPASGEDCPGCGRYSKSRSKLK